MRICLSDAVQESIAPYASGPSCVIPSGVDPALFFDDGTRQPGTVFIWGGKNPAVADGIARALESRGVRVHAAAEWLPRPVFASRLRASDVFVALPMPREGFFRNGEFLHPDLRFRMRVPSDWKTQNTKQAVLATLSVFLVMLVLYTGWGLWEIASLPSGPLP